MKERSERVASPKKEVKNQNSTKDLQPLFKLKCILENPAGVLNPWKKEFLEYCWGDPSCIFFGTSIYDLIIQHCQWNMIEESFDPELNKQLLREGRLLIDFEGEEFSDFVNQRNIFLQLIKEIQFVGFVPKETIQLLTSLDLMLDNFEDLRASLSLAKQIFPKKLLKPYLSKIGLKIDV